MQAQGIIKGKNIELAHETGIPDETSILMDIQLLTPTAQNQHALVDQFDNQIHVCTYTIVGNSFFGGKHGCCN